MFLDIEFGMEERPNKAVGKLALYHAMVTMGSEKTANRAMRALNGYELNGQRLALSPAELPNSFRSLTRKERQFFESMAEELEETDKKPLRMLEAIINLCGVGFAEAILEETNLLEKQDGIMTTDKERRRTKGGVFFYLSRFRMSPELRRIVYNRKGKFPNPDLEAEETKNDE